MENLLVKENELDILLKRYPKLKEIRTPIWEGFLLLKNTYDTKNKLLVAGNGGSASDAEHIVGELMKEFVENRGLNVEFKKAMLCVDDKIGEYLGGKIKESFFALSLNGHPAFSSACNNDISADITYAQEIYGFGKSGDTFLAISTSGNANNIVNAAVVAKAKKMKVLALTGKQGGDLVKYADVSVIVPEMETYKIQELHLPIYHWWCLMLEKEFFGNGRRHFK